MAVIDLGMYIPPRSTPTDEPITQLRRQWAEGEKMWQSHGASIDSLKKSQELQQATINRISEILREMQPTVQSLKNLATILRQVPNFPTTSSPKAQRMAG
jgi:hypothetical protein